MKIIKKAQDTKLYLYLFKIPKDKTVGIFIYLKTMFCLKLNELGLLNEKRERKILTYNNLLKLKKVNLIKLYLKLSSFAFRSNMTKIAKKDKIKVAFVCPISSIWSCEILYKIFRKSDKYDPIILVTPFFNGTDKTVSDIYLSTLKYFKENGYNCIGTANKDINDNKTWSEVGKPDIIFQLNPHHSAFPNEWKITELPLTTVNCYIPYGFMIFKDPKLQFNQEWHWLFSRIFCETEMHKLLAKKYCDVGDWNVVYSGYTKMDTFIEKKEYNIENIWKICNITSGRVVKLIYSPHHSVGNKTNCQFSTFDQNYKMIYEYAKAHKNTTSWIFKSHPLLEKSSVQEGIFKNENEYKQYVQMWSELPNAKVAEEGTYEDIFMTSDGMINDSVSFLAEYLYTQKPLLFLRREGNRFNEFGEKLVDIHYSVSGSDFKGIEKFIDEVVIGRNDVKSEKRKAFFESNLNYYKVNGFSASKYIFNYLNNIIEELN